METQTKKTIGIASFFAILTLFLAANLVVTLPAPEDPQAKITRLEADYQRIAEQIAETKERHDALVRSLVDVRLKLANAKVTTALNDESFDLSEVARLNEVSASAIETLHSAPLDFPSE